VGREGYPDIRVNADIRIAACRAGSQCSEEETACTAMDDDERIDQRTSVLCGMRCASCIRSTASVPYVPKLSHTGALPRVHCRMVCSLLCVGNAPLGTDGYTCLRAGVLCCGAGRRLWRGSCVRSSGLETGVHLALRQLRHPLTHLRRTKVYTKTSAPGDRLYRGPVFSVAALHPPPPPASRRRGRADAVDD
jgi:hypothetical protein